MEPENIPLSELVPVEQLVADDRTKPDPKLVEDIKRNGLKVPIAVNAAPSVAPIGTIVDGRRRVAAAAKLGWTEIPGFRITSLDECADALSLAHTSPLKDPFRLREIGLLLREYAALRSRVMHRRNGDERMKAPPALPARNLYSRALGEFKRMEVVHRGFDGLQMVPPDPVSVFVVNGWRDGTLSLSRGISTLAGKGEAVILRGRVRDGAEQEAILNNTVQALLNIATALKGIGPLDVSGFKDIDKTIKSLLRARATVETLTRNIQRNSGVNR